MIVVMSLFAVERATRPIRLSFRAFAKTITKSTSSTNAVVSHPTDDIGIDSAVHETAAEPIPVGTLMDGKLSSTTNPETPLQTAFDARPKVIAMNERFCMFAKKTERTCKLKNLDNVHCK